MPYPLRRTRVRLPRVTRGARYTEPGWVGLAPVATGPRLAYTGAVEPGWRAALEPDLYSGTLEPGWATMVEPDPYTVELDPGSYRGKVEL